MLFEIRSAKSLEEIDRRLREAAARHEFGVLAVHDVKEILRHKGVDYTGECVIYEVCNPHLAKDVLETNPSVSTALPCRISVYRDGAGYQLSTLLPTAMMPMFGPGLDTAAREAEAAITAMMTESA